MVMFTTNRTSHTLVACSQYIMLRLFPTDSVVRLTGPVQDWHTKAKGKVMEAWMNESSGALSCRKYAVAADGSFSALGTWPMGSLRVAVVTDEDSKPKGRFFWYAFVAISK